MDAIKYFDRHWKLPEAMRDKLKQMLDEEVCSACADTGDVHDQTGEWRGRCTCPAGRALLPWTPTDIRRNDAPCDGAARIDVRFRDGGIIYGAQAYTWAWGEADSQTITYWRMAR